MTILIAGMGFVGEPLAHQLTAQGHQVIGLTHSADSLQRLQANAPPRLQVRQADVSQSESLRSVVTEEEAHAVAWVIHCASSGRGGPDAYRRVYRDGLHHLHACCPQARLLFTSSSSVYAQTDGGWVSETDPAEPDRETGKLLRETEGKALQEGGCVARLAGIYGPGRSYILLKYLMGTAVIEGDGGRFVNQAHRDDIVSALLHLIESGATGIYNLVDSTPQTQRTLYAWLADHFAGELPPQAPPDYDRKRGWTHKRVSNEKLRASGWTPRYASFQDAVRQDPQLVPSIQQLLREGNPSRSA
jgi:nucleoside-diphosphate-sugar epimerase